MKLDEKLKLVFLLIGSIQIARIKIFLRFWVGVVQVKTKLHFKIDKIWQRSNIHTAVDIIVSTPSLRFTPFLQDALRPSSRGEDRYEALRMRTLVHAQQSKKFLYQRKHFSET